MENTYWNQTGKYQEQYNQMMDDLVPVSGKCDTLAGELVRSASRLGYDFYNNGMGNNTSGALNFLKHHSAIDDDVYDTIYEYTRGRIYNGNYNGDVFHYAIERMIDQTMAMIVNNPVLLTIENKEDMFDYEEEFQNFCETCGDETDRGWQCYDCERYDEENCYDEEEDYA